MEHGTHTTGGVTDRRGAFGLCLAAAVLFGAATPASKALLQSAGPLSLAALLYAGAAIAALPFAARAPRPRLGAGQMRRLGAAVLAGGVLAPGLLLMGLARAPAGSVSLWLNLEPVATTALAVLLFREHGGRRTWTAVAVATAAGIALAAPSGFDLGLAAALVAGACVLWGLDNNLSATIDSTTPAQTTTVKGVVAAVANGCFAWAAGEHLPDTRTALLALSVGAFGYGMSLILYLSAAQRLGAARSQLVFATAPFAAAALSWIALGEPIGALEIACGVTLAGAVGLLLTARHDHAHAHEPQSHTHSHRHDDGHHDHVHPGLPASVRHTHAHDHAGATHAHAHEPDLHHRHSHSGSTEPDSTHRSS
jgi:drug/metabolite transporter (DMT)-like permease